MLVKPFVCSWKLSLISIPVIVGMLFVTVCDNDVFHSCYLLHCSVSEISQVEVSGAVELRTA